MLSIGPLAGPTKTLVGQATRDNDSPPSGYQLDLLCKASFSSPSDCDQLLDAIIRRLDSSSANVKWKTLRVIAYLCQHGNAAIRKEFQRKIDRIRACTGFTGPQHPLRGDAPNERVRIAAKEALSALFSTPDPQSNHSNSRLSNLSGGESFDVPSTERDGVLGTALKSVLSTAANLVSNASSATGQISSLRPSGANYQITGIGNPAFQRSNSQSSVLDKMKQVFDPRWKSQSISQPPQSYAGLPMGGGPTARGDFDVKPAMLEGTPQRRRGQVGGNWADADTEAHISHSATKQGRFPERVSPEYETRHTQDADDDYGSLESRLIEELTTPGGVTAAPSSEQLSTLLSSIESLDQALIADLLAHKLDNYQSWQTQAKALSVIEALVKKDCIEVAQYFSCSPDNIINLASSNLRAVRIKADKVYEMLGLSKSSSVCRSQESPSQAPDLLDFPTDTGSKVDDLLDVNIIRNQNVSSSATTSDPLGFMLQSNDSHHVSKTSFPFISNDSHHLAPVTGDLPFVADQGYLPFVADQGYLPMSDSNVDIPASSPLNAGLFQSSDASSFLQGSGQDTVFRVSQPELLRSESAVTSASRPEHVPLQPGSAFSFVSQPVSEKAISDKPLDPFANAIKTVRKNTTASRDSFSFVQDIIKDSTHSR